MKLIKAGKNTIHIFRITVFILLIVAFFSGHASADGEAAAAQISVTYIQIDPEVFIHGDRGTIRVEISNSGTESVDIVRATILSNELRPLNDEDYNSVGSIGAGNKLDFTFTVLADVPDGIYSPKFYLDFRNAGSLRYRVPVKVESTELRTSVLNLPDSFSKDKKETISIAIGNPRENEINGITITPEGEGITTTPTGYFVGTLKPDEAAEVSFEVTPAGSTDLILHTTYRNGMNIHSSDISIPITISDDKKRAFPVINNIEITDEGGYHLISGDVTNAGLKDARSVVVRVGAPAVATDPFRAYVVGALEPDDFSSFEVTFTADDLTQVPLIIEYKDKDGNIYHNTTEMDLSSPGLAGNRNGEAGGGFPWIETALILVLIAGVYLAWKKGYLNRLTKKK